MGWIYLITNKINDKQYVGKTIYDCQTRWEQHLDEYKKHPHRELYAAMNKYGVSNFKIEGIEEVPDNELNDKEMYWISKYDTFFNGYNMTIGGDGGSYYFVDKELLYHLWDEDYTVSEIAKKINLPPHIVRNHLKHYNNYSLKESVNRSSAQKVYQYDVLGRFIREWDSASEAEEYFNNNRRADNIAAVCRKEQRTAYGYVWTYEYVTIGEDIHNENCLVIPINQFTKQGKFVKQYASIKEAIKEMKNNGYSHPHIEDVCKRKPSYNSAAGYVWRYYWDEF